MTIPQPQALLACPQCHEPSKFSPKRSQYYCTECELAFDAPAQAITPQTVFLSYAHKSEREQDFDVSEELVWLIKAELERDGHTVWIDHEGIRGGSQWRERITAAILGHAHFLSFLSRRSVRDPGVCLNEIAIALGGSRHIQTVLAEEEGQVAAPLTISHIQWHDFQHWRDIRAGKRQGPMGEDWPTWFAQRVQQVRHTLADAQNARVVGELQKLKEILQPRTFEARIVKSTEGFTGREWLVKEVNEWLAQPGGRLYWLQGGPGFGKSAFAAHLAHQARSSVIGFFMCDFQSRKDPAQAAREAICTLAFQMASRLPDYRLKLLWQQQISAEQVQKRTPDDLFEYLITEPLNRAGKIPEATRLCLVIDALDEAGRGDGNALAEMLYKHAAHLPDWLRVLITSRPEPALKQWLQTPSGHILNAQEAQHQADLAAWVQARLPESLVGPERERVCQAVLAKSGGTFLYLSLVAADPTLNLAQPDTLPEKLDGYFKAAFTRYFPDHEAYRRHTEPYLRLLAAAPGPLPDALARQLLGWGQVEFNLYVGQPMGSLLLARDGGTVFFHASLRDWLRDPQRSGSHVVQDTGAAELARFIWQLFETQETEGFDACPFPHQLREWLAELMPALPQWGDPPNLARAAEFLQARGRAGNVVAVLRQRVACIQRQEGPETTQAAEAWRELSMSLSLVGDSFEALCTAKQSLTVAECLAERDPNHAGKQLGLSRSHYVVGHSLEKRGDLPGAYAMYDLSRRAMEGLVAQDPTHTGWQSELGGMYSRVAGVQETQGNPTGALGLFEKSLTIAERLAAQDPSHTGWQRDLGVCYNRVGGAFETLGDIAGAMAMFAKGSAVFERLTSLDPRHNGWQQSLGTAYNRVGAVLFKTDDFAGALAMFEKQLVIAERLAAQDPSNIDWLAALRGGYLWVGRALLAQGNSNGAFAFFEKSKAISERLAALDWSGAVWKQELGLAYHRMGEALQARGDLTGALNMYAKHLTTAKQLAACDPSNVVWQETLSLGHLAMGKTLFFQGDLDGALAHLDKSRTIAECLAAQDSSTSNLENLAMACTCLGVAYCNEGDLTGGVPMVEKAIAVCERLTAKSPAYASSEGFQNGLVALIKMRRRLQSDMAAECVFQPIVDGVSS